MSEYALEQEWRKDGAHQHFTTWLCDKIEEMRDGISEMKTQLIERAEAAEARAADEELRAKSWHDSAMTLADQRDAAYKRNTELEAERDEARATCERMNEIIKKIATERGDARQERDEARRQLIEAQHAIDAMAQIVGSADEVKHQLEQARSDIEDYRAEIARLLQAATTPKHIQEALNEGDGVYRP